MARTIRYTDEYLAAAFHGEEYLLFEGGMGTMLQKSGAPTVAGTELLNLIAPDIVTDIQRQYVQAGSQVVSTNTFGLSAGAYKGRACIEEIVPAAVACARAAGAPYLGADIGPVGELLDPYGDLEEDECLELFQAQVIAAANAGVDFIHIETMADVNEMLLAVQAAQENCDLPVIASMSYAAGGRTFMGQAAPDVTAQLCAAGADVVGMNCSLGPKELEPLVASIMGSTTVPVIVQPNAGLPRMVDGQAVYDVTAAEFAQALVPILDAGATFIGGCCGTTPAFIVEIAKLLEGRKPAR